MKTHYLAAIGFTALLIGVTATATANQDGEHSMRLSQRADEIRMTQHKGSDHSADDMADRKKKESKSSKTKSAKPKADHSGH